MVAHVSEKQVVDYLESWLSYRGLWHVNTHGSSRGRRGVADFITCDYAGRLLGVEAKAPGERPRVNQLREAIRMLGAGGRYVVYYGDCDPGLFVDEDCFRTTSVIGREIGRSEYVAHDAVASPMRLSTEYVFKD